MKKNIGNIDRIGRIVVALVFVALYATQVVTGTAGVVLLVLGGVFVATSAIGFCPIYAALGLSTCPAKQ